jgi:hypothetical protein
MIRAAITTTKQQPSIQSDRKRTNFFRDIEQPVLHFLCSIMPAWITPDILTVIGFAGSCIAAIGFAAAAYNPLFLLMAISGFAIQWFGDSLDGRIAYYRNQPRKWYGFSLDLCTDWISTILIGLGFYYYLPADFKVLSFTFVTVYGWAMLLAVIKFKLSGNYTIDNGLLGPTEFRLAICGVLAMEIIFPGTFFVFASIVNVILVAVCLVDFYKLLQLGNEKDREEREAKSQLNKAA